MRILKIFETKEKYDQVTLYLADDPEEKELGTFTCFYEATEVIKDGGYSIVYLEEDEENKYQRWGLRQWNP